MKKIFLSMLLLLAALPMLHAQTTTIVSGGRTREMIVYAPKNLGENRPLLISMHGYNQDMGYQRSQANYEAVADTAKFVVVYPNGIDRSWDTGGDRDINFILDIIDDMVKKHKINRNRVYLSGFSMGGMMTYAAMNKIADKIAAFAPVSGYNMGGPNPKSSRPIPILHVHGTGDDVCGYDPVMSHVEAWAKYDKCNMTAVVQKPKSGPSNTTAELIRYRGGQNGVEVAHLKLPGKGHWHSNDANYAMTNIEIWNFCQRWSLVEGPKVKSVEPEDGSFDMDGEVHREFRIQLDKPLTLSTLKATLSRGTTTNIKLQASEENEGKTLVLRVPEGANIIDAQWTLHLTNMQSADGGKSNDFSVSYTYGMEEVGEAMKVDTVYQPAWSEMKETVGMGIPKGWKCINTDANGKAVTRKYTDSIPSTASHLCYYDKLGDFDCAFLLYPYKGQKTELQSGLETSTRIILNKGSYDLQLRAVYYNSRSKTNKCTFDLNLISYDGTETLFEAKDLAPTGTIRTTSETVSGSKLFEFQVDVAKTGRYNVNLSMAHTPASSNTIDGILVTAPLITTHPSNADIYKGGLLRALIRARALRDQLLGMKEGQPDDSKVSDALETLEQALQEYSDFADIAPSRYTAAIKALETAMKPAVTVGIQSTSGVATHSGTYDLQGRWVQAERQGALPKGVYIKDGRKVVLE